MSLSNKSVLNAGGLVEELPVSEQPPSGGLGALGFPVNPFFPYRAVSADDTATSADCILDVSAAGGARTQTLPPSYPSMAQGRVYIVRKSDGSGNAVHVHSAQAINGVLADFDLTVPGQMALCIFTGSSWSVSKFGGV